MKPGDRVKVVRIDDYTRKVCEGTGAPTSIGLVGTIEEIRYNRNMRQQEVIVFAEGCHWIFEPWNLMVLPNQ